MNDHAVNVVLVLIRVKVLEGDLEQGWESDIISASHVAFQNHSM